VIITIDPENELNDDVFKGITKIVENKIDEGKCVEIYTKSGDLLYFKKLGNKDFVYGVNDGDPNEWKATDAIIYETSKTIEFEFDGAWMVKREFDISDVTKIYIGMDWSN